MARTVGIRFRQAGKIFYYEGGDLALEVGNYVVVETSHGRSVGHVVISPDQVLTDQAIGGEPLKPIIRLATQEDVEQADAMKAKAAEDVIRAKGGPREDAFVRAFDAHPRLGASLAALIRSVRT